MTKNKECNHHWHFLREIYIDEWDSITSLRKYPRGDYIKVVCLNCGKVKYLKENEDS